MNFLRLNTSSASQHDIKRWAVIQTGIFTGLYILVGSFLGLSVDEGHYFNYGYFPALGYFDHPPLVGWINAVMQQIYPSVAFMRLAPILLHAVNCFLIYRLTELAASLKQSDGPRIIWAPLLAVSAYNGGVMFIAQAVALIPDTLLTFFSLLAVRLLLQFRLEEEVAGTPTKTHLWSYWAALGVTLGLAGLSKFSAFLLIPAVVVFAGGRCLRKKNEGGGLVNPVMAKKFIFAGILAAVIASPTLIWNIQNDFATFRFQAGRGLEFFDFRWLDFFLLQLSYVLLYHAAYPFLLIMFFGWLRKRSLSFEKSSIFLLVGVPGILFFIVISAWGEVLPHWIAPFVTVLLPVCALEVCHRWESRVWRRVAWSGVIISSFLFLVVFILIFIPLPFKDYSDPMSETEGWEEAAEKAKNLFENQQYEDGVVFVPHWIYAARVAWHIRPIQVVVIGEKKSQYNYWFPSPEEGTNGLLVVRELGAGIVGTDKDALDFFGDRCKPIDKFDAIRGSHILQTFHYYDCKY